MAARPEFFFDLGSPYAWLAAERIGSLLPGTLWRPVLLGGIFRAVGRRSWADTDQRAAGIREIERRAERYRLPPVRWPAPWPGNGLHAMRAATYADALGAGPIFALAAFRRAFTGGRDLSERSEVIAAGVEARLDARAVEDALDDPDVKQRLREATDAAVARGVIGVPTLAVGDELFWGDDRLEDAAAALAA